MGSSASLIKLKSTVSTHMSVSQDCDDDGNISYEDSVSM